jgi:hypothetical protein
VRKRFKEFERPISDTSLESIEICISLRNLIHAHIRKEFKRKEDELFRQRIDAYKAFDWQKYDSIIRLRENLYRKLVV